MAIVFPEFTLSLLIVLQQSHFLRALRYGMLPTVGVSIGIDRLAVIMTHAASIQEVIFFPQMRPGN